MSFYGVRKSRMFLAMVVFVHVALSCKNREFNDNKSGVKMTGEDVYDVSENVEYSRSVVKLGNKEQYKCNGLLLGERTVLTSSRCKYALRDGKDPSLIFQKAGEKLKDVRPLKFSRSDVDGPTHCKLYLEFAHFDGGLPRTGTFADGNNSSWFQPAILSSEAEEVGNLAHLVSWGDGFNTSTGDSSDDDVLSAGKFEILHVEERQFASRSRDAHPDDKDDMGAIVMQGSQVRTGENPKGLWNKILGKYPTRKIFRAAGIFATNVEGSKIVGSVKFMDSAWFLDLSRCSEWVASSLEKSEVPHEASLGVH